MRIEIIGPSASGKTSLGRMLSREFNIPHYQKDNVIWVRDPKGDRMRPAAERDAMYSQILRETDWIVEGVFRDSLNESMPISDCIIVLDQHFLLRLFRFIRRWIRRRKGLESYDAAPTISYLLYCLRWMMRELFQKKCMYSMLAPYEDKVAAFRNNNDAFRFLVNKYRPSDRSVM